MTRIPVHGKQQQKNDADSDVDIDELSEKQVRGYLKELMAKLKHVPLAEVSVVGSEVFEGQKNLIVLEGAKRLMISNLVGEVPVGETVWQHPMGMVAVAKTGRKAIGKVASIKAIKDGKALLVGSGSEERWVPFDVERFPGAKAGHRATVLDDHTIAATWREPSTTELGERPNVKYSDVGGQEDAIASIRRAIELPRKFKKGFERLKIRPSNGVLLHGPPGCGKTLIAKAVAGETGSAFYSVKVSDILSKWVGESEANIRELFNTARESAPSIIFFDEFDALGGERNEGDTTRVYSALVAEILSQMDGMDARGDLTIIAATNRLDMVDKAFRRPGRFDSIIEIGKPNRAAAEQIVGIHLPNNFKYDGEADEIKKSMLDKIFASKVEISGAVIEGYATAVKYACLERCGDSPKISIADVEKAGESFLKRD